MFANSRSPSNLSCFAFGERKRDTEGGISHTLIRQSTLSEKCTLDPPCSNLIDTFRGDSYHAVETAADCFPSLYFLYERNFLSPCCVSRALFWVSPCCISRNENCKWSPIIVPSLTDIPYSSASCQLIQFTKLQRSDGTNWSTNPLISRATFSPGRSFLFFLSTQSTYSQN